MKDKYVQNNVEHTRTETENERNKPITTTKTTMNIYRTQTYLNHISRKIKKTQTHRTEQNIQHRQAQTRSKQKRRYTVTILS